MIKIKKSFIAVQIALIVFFASNVFAGVDLAPFLKKGVGAKAIAMGGAFTSVADDPSAIYWNPAGLTKMQMYSVSTMGSMGTSDKYPGLKDIIPTHQFFAATIPLSNVNGIFGKAVVGIGYISSTMNGIQHTSDDGSQLGDTMSHTDNAYYLSMGYPIFTGYNSLSLGASLKYISYGFSDISASGSGMDLDAGVIYSMGMLNFGAMITKGVEIGNDKAPMTTKFGVSNKFKIGNSFHILGAMDLVQRQEEPLITNIGAEFGIKEPLMFDNFGINTISFRFGMEGYAIENRYDISSSLNETVGYNCGLGIDLYVAKTYLQLDIALLSGNMFEQSTKFSVNFYF